MIFRDRDSYKHNLDDVVGGYNPRHSKRKSDYL
jgi:hypothetical protein